MCPASRSTEAPSNKLARRPVAFPVSVSPLHPIRFDTHSPSTCWNPARMFARSSYCSATAVWQLPPGICGSPPVKYARAPVRSICCLVQSALIPTPPRPGTSKPSGHGWSEAGSGEHLPPLRPSLSREARRVDVHSAAACHDRHRGMQDGGSRRTDRTVRFIRSATHLLPIMQESPLPQVSIVARAEWIEHRQAELLNCEYFHVVFTVPDKIAAIAYQNKEVVYNILFQATAETLRTIAADPKHLGAEIGFFAVLHSWGSALLHHPHLHCVAPGGGLSPHRARWDPFRPSFFLHVRVLSLLFRRLFLEHLRDAF